MDEKKVLLNSFGCSEHSLHLSDNVECIVEFIDKDFMPIDRPFITFEQLMILFNAIKVLNDNGYKLSVGDLLDDGIDCLPVGEITYMVIGKKLTINICFIT